MVRFSDRVSLPFGSVLIRVEDDDSFIFYLRSSPIAVLAFVVVVLSAPCGSFCGFDWFVDICLIRGLIQLFY